jgi:hypothetical protein
MMLGPFLGQETQTAVTRSFKLAMGPVCKWKIMMLVSGERGKSFGELSEE